MESRSDMGTVLSKLFNYVFKLFTQVGAMSERLSSKKLPFVYYLIQYHCLIGVGH